MLRRTRRLVVVVLVVLTTAASCGADSDDEGGAAATTAGGGGPPAVAPGEQAALPVGEPLQAPRSIVYTAAMSLQVDDVEKAAAAAVAIAEDAGGFQSAAALDLSGDPTGSVEVRVPAPQFRPVLTALGELGRVDDQRVDAADVTDQVVDLEARLKSAQASLDRLRALLAEAQTITEISEVEAQVTAREVQVEQLVGQLRVVQDQVALATITVQFGEVAPPPLDKDPEPSEDIPGFIKGLKHGWVAFVNVVQVVLTALGVALPFAIVLVPGLVVWRWLRRRRLSAVSEL